jgi:hypothetical protein
MSKLTDELLLAKVLKPYHCTLFDGLTTHTERKEKARHAIRLREIATTRNEATKATYAELFLRTYGECL